jgi:hypothetical protein
VRKLAVAAAVLGTLAGACGCLSQRCLSQQQADAVRREFVSRNRARTEPAIRAALEERGAILLPVEATTVRLPAPCSLAGANSLTEFAAHDPRLKCLESGGSSKPPADGQVIHLKGDQGKGWLAITVSPEHLAYARLARRGSRLIFVRPAITRRTVEDRTECECDAMPRVMIAETDAFLIEDVPEASLEVVDVPMVEEYVNWHCKTRLL